MSEEEYEVEAIGVEVSCQPIELYKVLKIANAVSGGGEAKMAITEGYVGVNGDVETRKRCKVYDGDVIQFNGEFYLVLCDQPIDETPREKKPVTPPAANKSVPKPATNKRKNASSNQASSKKVQAKGQTAKAKKNAKAKVDNQPEQIDIQTGRRQIKF